MPDTLVQQAIDEAVNDAKFFNLRAAGDESLKKTFAKVQRRFPKMTWEMFLRNQAKSSFTESHFGQRGDMTREANEAYISAFVAEIVKFDQERHPD